MASWRRTRASLASQLPSPGLAFLSSTWGLTSAWHSEPMGSASARAAAMNCCVPRGSKGQVLVCHYLGSCVFSPLSDFMSFCNYPPVVQFPHCCVPLGMSLQLSEPQARSSSVGRRCSQTQKCSEDPQEGGERLDSSARL